MKDNTLSVLYIYSSEVAQTTNLSFEVTDCWQIMEQDISVLPFWHNRISATVSAFTILALGLLSARTKQCRCFGADISVLQYGEGLRRTTTSKTDKSKMQ